MEWIVTFIREMRSSNCFVFAQLDVNSLFRRKCDNYENRLLVSDVFLSSNISAECDFVQVHLVRSGRKNPVRVIGCPSTFTRL